MDLCGALRGIFPARHWHPVCSVATCLEQTAARAELLGQLYLHRGEDGAELADGGQKRGRYTLQTFAD